MIRKVKLTPIILTPKQSTRLERLPKKNRKHFEIIESFEFENFLSAFFVTHFLSYLLYKNTGQK